MNPFGLSPLDMVEIHAEMAALMNQMQLSFEAKTADISMQIEAFGDALRDSQESLAALRERIETDSSAACQRILTYLSQHSDRLKVLREGRDEVVTSGLKKLAEEIREELHGREGREGQEEGRDELTDGREPQNGNKKEDNHVTQRVDDILLALCESDNTENQWAAEFKDLLNREFSLL